MRVSSIRSLVLLAAAGVVAVVTGELRADVVLPGQRTVPVETEVTFGPYEGEASTPRWHFFSAAQGPTSEPALQRITSGQRTPFHRYGTKVVAVRADVVEAFEAGAAERDEPAVHRFLEEWASKPGVATSASIGGRTALPEASLVRTRVERWEVTAIDGNEISLRLEGTRDLDAEGAPVEGSAILAGTNGPLVALAGAALVVLLLRARRRAREVR